VGIQLGRRWNIARLLAQHLHPLNGIHREAAQVVAQVAPGIQIPVVAVMDEALRRDGAGIGLVSPPVPGIDLDALALQQGNGDVGERTESSTVRLAIDSSRTRCVISEAEWPEASSNAAKRVPARAPRRIPPLGVCQHPARPGGCGRFQDLHLPAAVPQADLRCLGRGVRRDRRRPAMPNWPGSPSRTASRFPTAATGTTCAPSPPTSAMPAAGHARDREGQPRHPLRRFRRCPVDQQGSAVRCPAQRPDRALLAAFLRQSRTSSAMWSAMPTNT
jgi:hypothetical protein